MSGSIDYLNRNAADPNGALAVRCWTTSCAESEDSSGRSDRNVPPLAASHPVIKMTLFGSMLVVRTGRYTCSESSGQL